MEFMILLGICVLIVAGVAWVGRRRRPDNDDPAAARRAHGDALAQAASANSANWERRRRK
jgi:hypothetical protein